MDNSSSKKKNKGKGKQKVQEDEGKQNVQEDKLLEIEEETVTKVQKAGRKGKKKVKTPYGQKKYISEDDGSSKDIEEDNQKDEAHKQIQRGYQCCSCFRIFEILDDFEKHRCGPDDEKCYRIVFEDEEY